VDRRADAAPGASFAQVNPAMAAVLGRAVVDAALEFSPARVVDGYAGAGDTAAELAGRGVSVTAIELDAEAARYAADRLGAAGRAVVGRVEDELPAALPPTWWCSTRRAPASTRASPRRSSAPRRRVRPAPRGLVYVSCNPATLARDLARLPSYRVRSVRPFDMFPQTAHVETLVVLERAPDPPTRPRHEVRRRRQRHPHRSSSSRAATRCASATRCSTRGSPTSRARP
jgi:23S rRNA (uracil1939-C5)-methyltransferase